MKIDLTEKVIKDINKKLKSSSGGIEFSEIFFDAMYVPEDDKDNFVNDYIADFAVPKKEKDFLSLCNEIYNLSQYTLNDMKFLQEEETLVRLSSWLSDSFLSIPDEKNGRLTYIIDEFIENIFLKHNIDLDNIDIDNDEQFIDFFRLKFGTDGVGEIILFLLSSFDEIDSDEIEITKEILGEIFHSILILQIGLK
jgi:hypothetical protein